MAYREHEGTAPVWPGAEESPFQRTGFYYGDGAVCIGWRWQNPWMGRVFGPFRNQTEAKAFGRKHFPRRYRVAGIRSPEGWGADVRTSRDVR